MFGFLKRKPAVPTLPVVPVDVILAIEPKFAEKADKAEVRGYEELETSYSQTNQANALLVKAAGHKERGERLINAVKAFRSATGGK